MRKIFLIIISSILLSSCGNSDTSQGQLVKSLEYDEFTENVWNIEKNPNTFINEGELPCIIDFYADWCGPCRKIAPIMEEIAQEFEGKVTVYKVNIDKEQKLPYIFEITSIPTVLFLPKEGQPLKSVGALGKEEYISIIKKHLN